MKQKIDVKLNAIQNTLFLPVWARAMETKKHKPIIYDTTAVRIIESVDFDFNRMSESISEIVQISWIARCKRFDEIINQFIMNFPGGTIVNIGCGLDTTYDRINNNSIIWYDLDLPEVIALRRSFISETEKRRFIPSSFLDTAWFELIRNSDNLLFTASNVFCYFEEKQIKGFFKALANTFNYAELFFDVSSPLGVRMGNRLLENIRLNSGPFFQWGLKDPSLIGTWNDRITLIHTYDTYKIRGLNLSFKNRAIGFLSDLSRNYFMVHLKIE